MAFLLGQMSGVCLFAAAEILFANIKSADKCTDQFKKAS